jgi:hypothetical protein
MSKKQFLMQNRTEEVADIIEKMPTRFGYIVGGIVICIVTSLFYFGWIVRYPELLPGEISINAENANVDLVANATGKLRLLNAVPGLPVKTGEVIAEIRNPANCKDIMKIDSLMTGTDITHISYGQYRNHFPVSVSVGELNGKYFGFLAALYQYLDYGREKPYELQLKNTLLQLQTQKDVWTKSIEIYKLVKNRSLIANALNARDSLLFSKMAISQSDIERSSLSKINSDQDVQQIEKDMINYDYQIKDLTSKLLQIAMQKMEKERDLQLSLYNSYYDLTENIKEWKRKYLFIAPIEGRLEFKGFLKNESFIQGGQELFTITPGNRRILGEVMLPEKGAGKVKIGQEVIIKLDDYPYNEYGSVKGFVKSISQVTSQVPGPNNQRMNTYSVIVRMPEGLKTNYGSVLDFRFEAKGTAEIVTDDRRLLERLFDNLKYRLKK